MIPNIIEVQEIKPDSWLLKPENKWFLEAYAYAAKTSIATAMAKLTPEEVYFLYSAIRDGITDVEAKKVWA